MKAIYHFVNWKQQNIKHKILPRKILATRSFGKVKRVRNGIARVRRPENPSSSFSHAGARGWIWSGEWGKSLEMALEGTILFLDSPSSSVRLEISRLGFGPTTSIMHPELLNHPILISRTVCRAYPHDIHVLFFHVAVQLAIFLARWWIKRDDVSVVSIIWRSLNTCWSTAKH